MKWAIYPAPSVHHKRQLIRFTAKQGPASPRKRHALTAVFGFLIGAGFSGGIVLSKESPVLLNRFVWDMCDAAEEIIALPAYAVAALVSYEFPYTGGFDAQRLLLISGVNGLIGGVLLCSGFWIYRYFRESLDISRVESSARQGAVGTRALKSASLAGGLASFATLLALAAPLVVREGVTSRWYHSFAWPTFGSLTAVAARALGSDLQSAFYVHPLPVICLCAVINGSLIGMVMFAVFVLNFARGQKAAL